MMTADQIQGALNVIHQFADRATASGLFKSVGDVLVYKNAADALAVAINEREEHIKKLSSNG